MSPNSVFSTRRDTVITMVLWLCEWIAVWFSCICKVWKCHLIIFIGLRLWYFVILLLSSEINPFSHKKKLQMECNNNILYVCGHSLDNYNDKLQFCDTVQFFGRKLTEQITQLWQEQRRSTHYKRNSQHLWITKISLQI